MVEMKLRPGGPWLIMWPLAIVTLGLVPLLMRQGERHFIARMDDQGFETRGGLRVGWNEIDRVERRVGKVQGMMLSDELLVYSSKGRDSRPTWPAENAEEAVVFFTAHAPADT